MCRRAWLLVGVLGLAAAGCGEPAALDQNTNTASVIVGLTSDLLPGVDIARLRVIERASGRPDREYTLAANDPERPILFPLELRFDDLPDGARVEARIEAFAGYFSDQEPLVSRSAATLAVAGRSLLLRARLERECIPNLRLTGDLFAPECELPSTCVAATCADPFVPPAVLEEYAASWAEVFADACKPLDAGEPVIVIGGGQASFEAFGPDSVAQVEGGPQGGFHVWLSLRMKNLHGAGTKTFVEIFDEGAAEPRAAFLVAQSYGPAEGGFCELLGLRCQITQQSTMDIEGILGDTVRVTAKVSDPTGDVGVGEQLVKLSNDVVKE